MALDLSVRITVATLSFGEFFTIKQAVTQLSLAGIAELGFDSAGTTRGAIASQQITFICEMTYYQLAANQRTRLKIALLLSEVVRVLTSATKIK